MIKRIYLLILYSMLQTICHAMESVPTQVEMGDLIVTQLNKTAPWRCPCCTSGAFAHDEKVRNKFMRKHPITATTRKAIATAGLFYGVLRKKSSCILQHIADGADINAKDTIGWAPIHYAIRDGNIEAASILFGMQGLDLESVNGNGFTVSQLIVNRKGYAFEAQQAQYDILLEYVAQYKIGAYPHVVKGHELIEIVTGKSVLSAAQVKLQESLKKK